jgi:hypothetical protein
MLYLCQRCLNFDIMKNFLIISFSLFIFISVHAHGLIDRKSLVLRNCPRLTYVDSLSSFSLGNGCFCYTADITGLQSFPNFYSKGVPLGTMSQWGWHSFDNPNHYKFQETLKSYDFRGHNELYSVEFKDKGRQKDAAEWFRANPHRLHLGIVGFVFKNGKGEKATINNIKDIKQQLNLWDGQLVSNYTVFNRPVIVKTECDPYKDEIAASFSSELILKRELSLQFRFPYPSGKHTDDGCDWNANNKHQTIVYDKGTNYIILKRIIDNTVYYVTITWQGKAYFECQSKNVFSLTPETSSFSFTCTFTPLIPKLHNRDVKSNSNVELRSKNYWNNFWLTGGAVDFSHCKDLRAAELERRVVLSQYLTAIQCAGDTPPQETGLTYNSWFGKFHLEMVWWHEAQFALWGHTDLLQRTLGWYFKADSIAGEIAKRQGFEGVRWMKMTDPSAMEAPSNVGSFLIWQQPHLIYLAELAYRNNHSIEFIKKYNELIQATAQFMFSFATYNKTLDRYELKGMIPAQETLRAAETTNPPFELSYWHFAMQIAQKWRERLGMNRVASWDTLINKLSPLAEKDGLYLAAETAPQTYSDKRFTSDHPAVLGALGILPQTPQLDPKIMGNTLHWIWNNWNWDETWGWDYPMVAMDAARLGEPDKAVDALLMKKRTNTYLNNGHNYQDGRLRIYLPGNGGLLTAVAMMCAGWDGNMKDCPGFPKDGKWDVWWEGLHPLP